MENEAFDPYVRMAAGLRQCQQDAQRTGVPLEERRLHAWAQHLANMTPAERDLIRNRIEQAKTTPLQDGLLA